MADTVDTKKFYGDDGLLFSLFGVAAFSNPHSDFFRESVSGVNLHCPFCHEAYVRDGSRYGEVDSDAQYIHLTDLSWNHITKDAKLSFNCEFGHWFNVIFSSQKGVINVSLVLTKVALPTGNYELAEEKPE